MMTTKPVKPTLPNVPVHDGKRFHWGPRGAGGATEASSLQEPVDAKLWDDACDVGFCIKSHRSGKTELFVLAQQDRAKDGELLFSMYESVNLPEKIQVIVFND